MANQPKVIKLGLEEVVLDARDRGASLETIRDECNAALKAKGSSETVSKPTVERYLGSLDRASVAPAHQPQLAERNARTAIDFGERLTALDEKLRRWLDEADQSVTPMQGVLWDPVNQQPAPSSVAERHCTALYDDLKDALEYMPDALAAQAAAWTMPAKVMVPDWRARTSVAKELRELLKLYADVIERVANARHVQEFQTIVFNAIREADAPTANKILQALREVREARAAGMLGLDG